MKPLFDLIERNNYVASLELDTLAKPIGLPRKVVTLDANDLP